MSENESQSELLKHINAKGYIVCTTSGFSMYPFLRHRRDVVVIKKFKGLPKKYDVLLYIDKSDRFVLHRVIKIKNGKAYIRGDNCKNGEYVDNESIIGILTEFTRKGIDGSCRDKKYLLYSKAVVLLHPAVRFRLSVAQLCTKIKNKVKIIIEKKN